jgi:hypothetical protein
MMVMIMILKRGFGVRVDFGSEMIQRSIVRREGHVQGQVSGNDECY